MDVNRINGAGAIPNTVAIPDVSWASEMSPELSEAVTAINGAKLFGQDSELTFAMDRQTKHMVIRLVEKSTHTLIRQIPPESILQMAQDLMPG